MLRYSDALVADPGQAEKLLRDACEKLNRPVPVARALRDLEDEDPAGLLSEAAVRELAEAWFRALEALADHAVRPGAGGHTASDFPLAQLSQEEMDSLFSG